MVPPGGEGLYYFSIYLLVDSGERGQFSIRVNGQILCTAYGDDEESSADAPQSTCSLLAQLTEGNSNLHFNAIGQKCDIFPPYDPVLAGECVSLLSRLILVIHNALFCPQNFMVPKGGSL